MSDTAISLHAWLKLDRRPASERALTWSDVATACPVATVAWDYHPARELDGGIIKTFHSDYFGRTFEVHFGMRAGGSFRYDPLIGAWVTCTWRNDHPVAGEECYP